MKKTWLILTTMMLVVAFSMSAFATDVKFSGEYLAGGMYLDKTTLNDDSDRGPSTAFYFQRLRVKTDFIVSPGLTLTTRFDAMERAWGAARTAPGTTADTQSMGTVAENENIAFDMVYVTYASPYGILGVGYQPESGWGTVFGNSNTSAGKISYTLPVKNFIFVAQLVKSKELSRTAKNPTSTTAASDNDAVYLMAMYKFKQGMVGIANFYVDVKEYRQAPGFRMYLPLDLVPFVKAKFGPVAVQAELLYQRGKQEFEISGVDDVDVTALAGWIDVVADFGMFYGGGTFAYVSGDDPETDKIEGGTLNGGNDFNPCLILWNYDRAYWAGNLKGYNSAATANGANMTNGFLYLLKAGVRPIDKLDIMGTVAYARADQKPVGYVEKDYGWELDLTATYKITNNLSYMLGVGYLFTGDFYKGTSTNHEVNDDLLVINKLTLTF